MEICDFVKEFLYAMKIFPKKTAAVSKYGKMTFEEIEILARKTASFLLSKNIAKNSFIPVILPYSAEYAAVEIGIWFAGHAAVPIGRTCPQDRVTYICENCSAPTVIDSEILEIIKNFAPCENFGESHDDDNALIVYTSGSTGIPKGVLHTFGSLKGVNYFSELTDINETDNFITATPFYFVAAMIDFSILKTGASIHLMSGEMVKDIGKFENYVVENDITAAFLVPSVLANYKNRSSKLRVVFVGGERLSGIKPNGYRLFNAYAMSETCIPVFAFEVDKAYENTPIGKPLNGVEWCILDGNGKPAKKGELCLKGNFSKGYYKDPEKTSKLFENGILHTGDIMEELDSGDLLFMDRKDCMVKVNGRRVELGEIEITMKNIPQIKNVVIKAFEAQNGSSYISAYYTTNAEISQDTIKEFILKKLPKYMLPTYFVEMNELPLNENGKLDRRILGRM